MSDLNKELEKTNKQYIKSDKILQINKDKLISEIINSNIKEDINRSLDTSVDNAFVEVKKNNKFVDFIKKFFKLLV